MGIIAWIVLGGVAGWLTALIMGNRQGIIGDIIVGIVGAMIGGWVATFFGGTGITGFNLWSLLIAVLGGVILTWIVRFFRRDTTMHA
jgi:uncharacterized membrane protein YeaQ/YmgE (transglycosylase-associated protein family)